MVNRVVIADRNVRILESVIANKVDTVQSSRVDGIQAIAERASPKVSIHSHRGSKMIHYSHRGDRNAAIAEPLIDNSHHGLTYLLPLRKHLIQPSRRERAVSQPSREEQPLRAIAGRRGAASP